MELIIRRGSLMDVDAFLNLLHVVKDSMENPEWFYLDPDEDVWCMMKKGAMKLWVAMDGKTLAGAFAVVYPGTDEHNYGYALRFSEQQLKKVIHMDTAVVHPAYRGLGLQRKLTAEAESALTGQGERILMSTVHPDNRFSLQNMQSMGYEVLARVEKYGSVRYVTRKYIY